MINLDIPLFEHENAYSSLASSSMSARILIQNMTSAKPRNHPYLSSRGGRGTNKTHS